MLSSKNVYFGRCDIQGELKILICIVEKDCIISKKIILSDYYIINIYIYFVYDTIYRVG